MSVRHLASLDWSTLSSFTPPSQQTLRSEGYLPRSRIEIAASSERCARFDGRSFSQAKPFTTSSEPQQSGGWLDRLWNGPAGPEPPAVTRYDPSAQEQEAEGRMDMAQVSSAPDALSPKYSRPRREDMERRRRRRKEEIDDPKTRASAAKVGEKRKRFKAYAAAGGGTTMQWEWEDAVVREGPKGGSEREPGPINSPPGETNSASWVVRKMPRDHREHLRDLAAMQRRRRTSDRKRSGLGVTRKELAEFEESLSRRPFQILGEPKQSAHQMVGNGGGPPAGKAHVLGRKDHALEVERVPPAAWFVVRKLQRAGHEAYLAGGVVRDLLLKRTPKDIDIVSTASPNQVRRVIPRTMVFGRRFRIAQVTVGDVTVEVSSFDTISKPAVFKGDTCHEGGTPAQRAQASRDRLYEQLKGHVDPRRHHLLDSALRRDLTINGMLFDPINGMLYDFCGGAEDIEHRRIRTIIDAEESFLEDPGRVLRAIRIAARTNFELSKETEEALAKVGRSALLSLDKSRVQLELNVMLGYGSARRSVELLWRTGLLEIMLPLQAEYLTAQNFPRSGKAERPELLFDLLEQLDELTNPGAPCHGGLWVALLALHLAAHELQSPPVIVLTLAKTTTFFKIDHGIIFAHREAIKHQYKSAMQQRKRMGGDVDAPGDWLRKAVWGGVCIEGGEVVKMDRHGREVVYVPNAPNLRVPNERIEALTVQLAERADKVVGRMTSGDVTLIRRLAGLEPRRDCGAVMRADAARASALFTLVAKRESPEVVNYLNLLKRMIKGGEPQRQVREMRVREADLKEGRIAVLAEAFAVIVAKTVAPVSGPARSEGE